MKKLFAILALAVQLVSCYGDEHLAGELSGSKKISLNAEIKQVPATRVNDNGFCDGDVIGVYIVDYQGENAGELRSEGNRADNVYAYYPYMSSIESVTDLPFSVSLEQNELENYMASVFLWASVEGVSARCAA